MLVQIIAFLLEVLVTLVGGACVLRVYMRWQGVNLSHPVGRFVQALSDWLVLPLRRVIRPSGKIDLSCLLGAVLVQLLHYLVLWAVLWGAASPVLIPLLALFGLLRMVLTGLIGILLIHAILSWVQPHAPVAPILARLSEPVLRPLRRIIPLVGNVDLSPLVALIALQVLLMVLANVQFNLMGR